MADSPIKIQFGLVDEYSDLGEIEERREEFLRHMAASRNRINDLERESSEAAAQEAETALQLEDERGRREVLDQELSEARNEVARLHLRESSQETGAAASADLAAVVDERDRLAGEVDRLSKDLAAAQAEPTELLETIDRPRRERDEIAAQIERIRADREEGTAAGMVANHGDEATGITEATTATPEPGEERESEGRNDNLSVDDGGEGRLTRYERKSAKLPSMGDDALEVAESLEGLRKRLRKR